MENDSSKLSHFTFKNLRRIFPIKIDVLRMSKDLFLKSWINNCNHNLFQGRILRVRSEDSLISFTGNCNNTNSVKLIFHKIL